MKKIDQTRTLVFCALLAAAAMTIGYIESLFPLPLPIPGARIGLANTVVLLALMLFGAKAAAAVLAVKIVLSALLFGTPISMLYAATGGTLALTAMALLGRCKGISPIGQSVAGAVLYNLGQGWWRCCSPQRRASSSTLPRLPSWRCSPAPSPAPSQRPVNDCSPRCSDENNRKKASR